MREFKFFKGITEGNPYIRLSWVGIEFDGYRFRIQTHHSSHVIGAKLRELNRFYMRMWNDGMNRDRILELLRERFADAINVIDHDELVRNGGYI
jgi:hypothetical protein